jgi:hypothetical protein
MTEKRSAATSQVLRHVTRAREALDRLDQDSTTSEGVFRSPIVQGAALKIAAEEIRKALAVFEKTKWK